MIPFSIASVLIAGLAWDYGRRRLLRQAIRDMADSDKAQLTERLEKAEKRIEKLEFRAVGGR